jgi:hypothetical protein
MFIFFIYCIQDNLLKGRTDFEPKMYFTVVAMNQNKGNLNVISFLSLDYFLRETSSCSNV